MWYDKYVDFPYRHLGNDPETGIDCFNLIRLVYKNEKNIFIPYSTADFCNIVDQEWYNKIDTNPFTQFRNAKLGWEEISLDNILPFDVAIMSIGSTNCVNHCAVYVDRRKILQIMINRKSWISLYGNYYKQYTLGLFRWKGMPNE